MLAPLPYQRCAMGTSKHNPHVLINGGGFAGVTAARKLANSNVTIPLIDRQNHHVFQPLLYEVATAGFSATTIAEPLRGMFRKQHKVTVLMGNVDNIDVRSRQVRCGADSISYDYLIVAAGARQSYFGRDEWKTYAPSLKTIEDALDPRARLLGAFETAERTKSSKAPTFVVVGGGPIGVELAGHIAELSYSTIACDFKRVAPGNATIILIEGGSRLLPAMSERASESARIQLERLRGRVVTSATVCQVGADYVLLKDGTRIDTQFIAWAAGVAASPLGSCLEAPLDPGGRVEVGEHLCLTRHPEVFVVGDLAFYRGPDGKMVPGTAPAAKQMGRHAAAVIHAKVLHGRPTPLPFVYRDDGALATIGRNAAVAQLHSCFLSGRLAWFFWMLVHVVFLHGTRRRLAAALTWARRRISGQRAARVILRTQAPETAPNDMPAEPNLLPE